MFSKYIWTWDPRPTGVLARMVLSHPVTRGKVEIWTGRFVTRGFHVSAAGAV